MSDLRDLIAAVINSAMCDQNTWQGTLDCTQVADAVIEELGLYIQTDSAGRTCVQIEPHWEKP